MLPLDTPQAPSGDAAGNSLPLREEEREDSPGPVPGSEEDATTMCDYLGIEIPLPAADGGAVAPTLVSVNAPAAAVPYSEAVAFDSWVTVDVLPPPALLRLLPGAGHGWEAADSRPHSLATSRAVSPAWSAGPGSSVHDSAGSVRCALPAGRMSALVASQRAASEHSASSSGSGIDLGGESLLECWPLEALPPS